MKCKKGFTIIELLIIMVIAGVASIFFFIQKSDIEVSARDSQRKTAINAMYFGIEEVFYKENKFYPRNIDSKTLRSVDPGLFTDPFGIKINEADGDYTYTASDCEEDKCKKYALRAILESEDNFVKNNRN